MDDDGRRDRRHRQNYDETNGVTVQAMRGVFWLPLVLAVAMLTGCALFTDDDAVKLCRSLIPAFNPDPVSIVIRDVSARETSFGTIVSIAYDAESTRRTVTCMVNRDRDRRGLPQLTNMATEDGPLGDIRLYLLRKNWIESGRVAISDPSPVVISDAILALPRPLAVALQHGVSSLPLISIYALLAAAYALIYGLVGRINLAFGELAMLAGYGAFLGFSMLSSANGGGLAVVAAVVVGLYMCASYGAAFGRFVLAPLLHSPGQHILIATIGLSIFMSELVRLMQGNGTRWLSPLLGRPFAIARHDAFIVTVTPMTLVVALVTASAVAGLLFFLQRGRFGMRWRALADDAVAASLLGVDPRRVLLQTMLLASLLCGLGGILTTLMYGGVGHAGSFVVGLKALIAAIIGGIGSVRGAIAGAIVLGFAEAIWSVIFQIETRDPAIFVGLALLLALRPEGLFVRQFAHSIDRPTRV
jgi:branched-subunit amino acid ABC-type transport system permease component